VNYSLKIVGFIVNPIAGMGGAVGLKGTDGRKILEKARALGAKPTAPIRAESFLRELGSMKSQIRLLTGAGRMGDRVARKLGFSSEVIGQPKEETTPMDTKVVAKTMIGRGIEILVFCGGDGTARDILDVVDLQFPVLGVPTGVKMHSAVFATDPIAAARIVLRFLWDGLPLKEVEVMDVDEEVFRQGRVSAKLYGYVLAPYEPQLIQTGKMASASSDEELRNQAAIAVQILDEMEKDVVYIIGPGTTTRIIAELLEVQKTLLGVDLLLKRVMIASDANEQRILKTITGKRAKIIVTPIGGQGFIFGRGNQQISPSVIRTVGRNNVIVIATKNKLKGLKVLRIDTGDSELDKEFRGYRRVITDYREEQVVEMK
jgi:predicted polyphosphate/ATP-dependent NAD kinase